MSGFGGGPADVARFRENCFVRDAPCAAGAVLAVMKLGQALPRACRADVDGWLAVVYRGHAGWVAGRFVEGRGPELSGCAR